MDKLGKERGLKSICEQYRTNRKVIYNRFWERRMFRVVLPLAIVAGFFFASTASANDCGCVEVTKCRTVKKLSLERVCVTKPVTRLRLKCVTDCCGCTRMKLCKETTHRQVSRLRLKVTECCKCKTVCRPAPKPCCTTPAPCCN